MNDLTDIMHPDLWLSGIIGRQALRLEIADLTADQLALLPHAIAARSSPPVFLYAKVPAWRTDMTACLENSKLTLVDTNITLEKNVEHRDDTQLPDILIRTSRPEDRDAVVSLAKDNFIYTRFHLDPEIPTDTANLIKAAWADNYYAGKRGDEMIVAVHGERITGFLLAINAEPDSYFIDLIAVDKDFRRLGIGAAMIRFAESRTDRTRYGVGTQIANLPSLRLYEKLGFRICGAAYVFHGHFNGNTA